ncbi:MBL fold metallo-hydrolase [Ferrimonas lipolytica]|uniref:MBL fold metallo-hydrolase n=1 Tax=Ferrimonas lipolytica TaxID=2724191 RepID=A0A6H1UC29_9GAMM|nr:MBL fold metallo-hydrolase [Ferrimonas lipolytica]QIZ76398.1 MBL fold metallo-hydrolase [Ferrimonas lipolytica]
MRIDHHGAVSGVTGSCHQLFLNDNHSLLIDCGLFQGAEKTAAVDGDELPIDFAIDTIDALLVTHSHIDHVGRIPYLLASGFNGPIYASEATSALLPLVLEDALKVGVTRNSRLINAVITKLKRQLQPLPYKQWQTMPNQLARIRLQPAGHILGSAYIEIQTLTLQPQQTVVFSGDLGAPYTPLLPSPKPPYRADILVIESTYGDKLHQRRKARRDALQQTIERAVSDNGIVLIPAFSMGRTQELLYELEQIHHKGVPLWQKLEIIVDSPLAAKFSDYYQQFKQLWDKEAKRELAQGRHPLDFDTLYTVDSHANHLATINYLQRRNKPAVVIAASGMCSGGRIMNYLEAFLPDPRTDIVFVGYQAQGTPGRDIQQFGPKGGYVILNGNKININAKVHTISGYSAHADQKNLISFATRMRHPPKHIRIVHGDNEAKQRLQYKLQQQLVDAAVIIPTK